MCHLLCNTQGASQTACSRSNCASGCLRTPRKPAKRTPADRRANGLPRRTEGCLGPNDGSSRRPGLELRRDHGHGHGHPFGRARVGTEERFITVSSRTTGVTGCKSHELSVGRSAISPTPPTLNNEHPASRSSSGGGPGPSVASSTKKTLGVDAT